MGECCSKSEQPTQSDIDNNPKRGLLSSVADAYSNAKQKVAGTIDDGFDYVSPYWLTLKNITDKDNLYYVKCTKICNSFIQNDYNRTPPILHDAETHENNWDSILLNAEKCQDALYKFLDIMVESMISLYDNNNIKENIKENNKTEVARAGLKKLKRSKEKVETNYDGNWLRLCDVCRSSIVHDSFQDLYFLLLILYKYRLNCFGFEIVKIKNRYQSPTDQGWADVTLLIQPTSNKDIECELIDEFVSEYETKDDIEDGKKDGKWINIDRIKQILNALNMNQLIDESLPKHICEVQLIHRAMWEKRKHGVFGHGAYGLVRAIDAKAVKVGDNVGHGDTINEMIEFRGHIMGGLGQKIFVNDDVNESAGSILKNVTDQLGDEAEYVYNRVTSVKEDDGDDNNNEEAITTEKKDNDI